MSRDRWIILSLAYVVGLLFTGVFGFPNPHPSWQQWGIVILGIGLLTLGTYVLLRRRWRKCPRGKFWLGVALISLLGSVYFQFRVPQPRYDDISQVVKAGSRPPLVTVLGKVLSEPRLTSNQRQKFWLNAKRVQIDQQNNQSKSVTGKLYVTLPLSEENKLYSGQIISLKGVLYKPRSPTNPGAFDFKKYLAKDGIFAGLKGQEINFKSQEPGWGWAKVRQRIVHAFIQGLGKKEGLVMSSMILGRQAVDLPTDVRDLFVRTGLAHVLAASGFHVALLLGIVLWITQGLSPPKRLIFGILILSGYTGLTGIQPSILRATLMGVAVLIGMILRRKTNSLGSLGFAGFLLLLWNPLWIWDLGFQLSFIATFSLIQMSSGIEKGLDWLPSKIAGIVAVPIAASVWTFPLIIYVFYSFSLYAIPCNIITTPLIMIITLGGMISASVALISPLIGSYLVQLFYYPLHLLLAIQQLFIQFPFNSLAIGKISLEVLLTIYGLLVLVWLSKFWRQRFWLGGLLIILLITIPIFYKNSTLVQVTILSTQSDPVIVIQDRGKVTIINPGDQQIIKYNLFSFLAQQGIKNIATVVVFDSRNISDWSTLNPEVTVDHWFYSLGHSQPNSKQILVGENLSISSTDIQLLRANPFVIQWKLEDKTWLWIKSSNEDKSLPRKNLEMFPQVLLWSGKSFPSAELKQVMPKVAIASTPFISKETQKQLQERQVQLYWLQKDGAIQWTPSKGFQTILENQEQDL